MIAFWIGSILLLLVVLVVLGLALLRPRVTVVDRSVYDLLVYKKQLLELEKELERGILTPDQADSARLEIQRRILKAGGRDDSENQAVKETAPRLAIFLLIAIPLGSFALYSSLGSPYLPDQPHEERVSEIRQQLNQIQEMIAQMENKVKENPNNVENWKILARTYSAIGDMDKAKDVFQKIFLLDPKDIDSRLGFAALLLDMSARQIDPIFPTEIAPLMDEVLALEPLNLAALYYGGLAAAQVGDKNKARLLWNKAIENLPADAAEDKFAIQEQIRELDKVEE